MLSSRRLLCSSTSTSSQRSEDATAHSWILRNRRPVLNLQTAASTVGKLHGIINQGILNHQKVTQLVQKEPKTYSTRYWWQPFDEASFMDGPNLVKQEIALQQFHGIIKQGMLKCQAVTQQVQIEQTIEYNSHVDNSQTFSLMLKSFSRGSSVRGHQDWECFYAIFSLDIKST